MTIKLREIALARSGDKGNHANIGVVALAPVHYDLIKRELTAQRVLDYFQSLGPTSVERFELPKIHAFNFVLHNVLDGGASRSLRTDTQGKLLGTALMEMELPADIPTS